MCCPGLTDAAFAHLRGIKALFLEGCDQPAITDAAITHLRGIRTLQLDACPQVVITGSSFSSLAGIGALCLNNCSGAAQAAARALGLPVPAGGLFTLGGYACAFYPWRTPRAAPW